MLSTLDVTGVDGGIVGLPATGLDDLRSRLTGPILLPDHPGWAGAVRIWNGAAARRPAVVVQPACTADVAATVRFAVTHRLLLGVKGGGHNVGGIAIAAGGLVLDMSALREVAVHPDARLVHVGAGCLLADVDQATQRYGLATVLGMVSDTGVAGLTLGGGFGYLTRRFGWTVDNVHEVEIVTADGAVRTAHRTENAELFWAVRGGGGNLGVVTRFTFQLHPVGPTITGGFTVWDGGRAAEVLAAYRRLTESAPAELTAAAFIAQAPHALPERWHGKPVIGLLVAHTGSDPVADLAVVRAVPDPIVDAIGEMTYVEMQSMFDGELPAGHHYCLKSAFLPGLSTGFLDAFAAAAVQVPALPSEAMIVHIGGRLNELADDDGAVGNRDARYVCWFDGAHAPDKLTDSPATWARNSWEAIHPFSTGRSYLNFQMGAEPGGRSEEQVRTTYDANYSRLVQAKKTYDPGNVFRTNRNVPPR